jgi:hypothetical protein
MASTREEAVVRPMIDDLELPQVQEIDEHDLRALAEHKAPGMDGSTLQNLGRRPTGIRVSGVATGPDAISFVEQLEEKFGAAEPVSFTADIVADAELEFMLIDDLSIDEIAGRPERFAYTIDLREHIEPVEPARTGPDTDILADALGLVDALTMGLEVVEQLSAFVTQLTELNSSLTEQGTAALFPSA